LFKQVKLIGVIKWHIQLKHMKLVVLFDVK
jgi:hypothetical protein